MRELAAAANCCDCCSCAQRQPPLFFLVVVAILFFFFFGSAALSFLLPCRASPTGGLVAWWARSGWAGRRGGFCFHFFSFFFFPRVWFRSGFGLAWSFKSAFFFLFLFFQQTNKQADKFFLSVFLCFYAAGKPTYVYIICMYVLRAIDFGDLLLVFGESAQFLGISLRR